MEHESFEDSKTAEYLNENYVSIKVDREERPDVDSVYMNVCQALTGSGGWPLSIFMDSDKKPFFAGTYYPKQDYRGMIGFTSLLKSLNQVWTQEKMRIGQASDEIIKAISIHHKTEKELSNTVIEHAVKQLANNFDPIYGGFARAPKFPTPHNLLFLLRYYYTSNDKDVLDMVVKTLDSMMCGGIYDHIGYGFSRYSTDEKWLVPHFEKMLYDNALLAMAYTEGYQVTKFDRYKKIANEIFTYVLRDMQSGEGGFYTAEDADSEGVEGKFYVWTKKEIITILGEENGQKFCELYDITQEGNFEEKNIPNLIKTGIQTELPDFCRDCIDMLYQEREKRVHPLKDKKILTAWNGLMISALSMGGKAFENEEYIRAAEKSVEFIYQHLMPDGELKTRFCDGEVGNNAYVDDFSFLIWGLIELYEASYQEIYLQRAVDLMEKFIRGFWDEEGGFFLYGNNAEQMITRPKEIYDGAMPSANAVSAYNLIRLARLTGCQDYEEKARLTLNCFGKQIENMPMAHTFSVMAAWYLDSNPKDVVLVSEKEEYAKDMLHFFRTSYLPNVTSLYISESNKEIQNIAEFTKDYRFEENKCLAYVCEGYVCKPPVSGVEQLNFK